MSHITSTRIDCRDLRASDLQPVDQLEHALRARLGTDIPITYIPSAGNAAVTLDNELARNNLSQNTPVHATRDVTTTPASLYMYIFRPSDRGRIASLIRHHFRVEIFTQSHTYDELEEVGSHTTQSVADAYFIDFHHTPGPDWPRTPWRGPVKVEVISESPWNVKFKPYLGESRYLESYLQQRTDDISDMQFLQTKGSLENINYVLKTCLTRRSDSCQWHAQKIPQSAKILEMFLKAHNCYSSKDLISMVQKHLVSVNESTYSNVERAYGVDCLPLGIFIIDHLLLEESETGIKDWNIGFADDSIHKAQNESEAYLYKLKILFSAMAWLGELFDLECFGQIFETELDAKIQRARVKTLFMWLGMPKQAAFLSSGLPPQGPEATDAEDLNILWHWLHQRNYRQVKFALAISKSGLIRERKDAIGFISDLSIKYLSMPPGIKY
ncbi:RelA/SpoT [Penicillium atrosanguineum]|uniref:RelA/SpoT n=1 Tax=Penicillium atrosanguineum TaxID=1132637 RepID=A0A9W9HHW0_9EURO|nr:Protein g.t1.c1 [Penicillium atrosanguineum]KAJ5134012.1 RelA/SpoT [Penicillium atrosanguineum]KAJ5149388.1 RelA/SpoT [Penicillium atrosanguineum]KAJ5304702.1 Protein g.t1.c1 [Penicillium atrosanguineum]KAJ5324167.1 RelA/SpoT [Penicillium atrosanguineum]